MLFIIALGLGPKAVYAADYQIIDVKPGENVDVYVEINLKGFVYARIQTRNGPGCANFWWIVWPLGSIKHVGNYCGASRFEIPGWRDLALWSKLRVGGVTEPTKIVAAATEAVAISAPVNW
jgi:hypothetical protein